MGNFEVLETRDERAGGSDLPGLNDMSGGFKPSVAGITGTDSLHSWKVAAKAAP